MNESMSFSSADAEVQWRVTVELGEINVIRDLKSSSKFTTFTFIFRVGQEAHSFTSRYSRLYKFQEALSKSEQFQKAFNYDPPSFPSKSYFTDYTKAKNYQKRAKKLHKWFEEILKQPAVLTDKTFQSGIHLPKHLQDKMTEIGIDWANMKRVLKLHHAHNNTNTGRRQQQKPKKVRPHPRSGRIDPKLQQLGFEKEGGNGMIIDEAITATSTPDKIDDVQPVASPAMTQLEVASFLSQLQQNTEDLLIDVTFEQEDMAIHSGHCDADKIEAARCFTLSQVLPSFLMPDDPLRSEPFQENTQMINEELLRMMDDEYRRNREKHLESVDKIAYEIRDLILSNCELLKE